MAKLFIVLTLAILAVDCAPQLSDVELKEQAFNRINEAEYDYKWVGKLTAADSTRSRVDSFNLYNPPTLHPPPQSQDWANVLHTFVFIFRFALSDGHEQEQQRKEVDGSHVVIGFYKYVGNIIIPIL